MLPAIIPTHWNAAGAIDGWMPKLRGAFVAPIGSLVTVACLILFKPIQIEEDSDDLKNGVVGIRTPWTLADKEVWARTNHVGGWLVVLAGVVMAATGLMRFRMAPGLIALGAAAVVSVGYSYLIWRRINGDGNST